MISESANFDNPEGRGRPFNDLDVPQVSILVTVFNRERYLPAALRSILDSTFTDFEVIVVDDCSADRSLEIARQVAAADARVHVFANSKNLGDYGNRMRAASLARGLYLKYVDSDDLIYRHGLQVMMEAMAAFPEAAMGISHSMPDDREPYPWRLDPEECYRKHFLERGCLGSGPTGAIVRRDVFQDMGGFRPEWGVLSDYELWLRIAAIHPIVLLPPGLVWWRRHEGQEFSKGDADDVYLQRGFQLEMQALRSQACPLPGVPRSRAIRRKKQHYARRILSVAIRRKKPLKALEMFQDSKLSKEELFKGFWRYQ